MAGLRQIGFFIILLLSARGSMAQADSPFSGVSGPFRMSTGSSFAASGGSGRHSSSAVKSITNDIREAHALIQGNHFEINKARGNSTISAALQGMLHALDPHSNYHDPGEWKELLDEQNSGYTGIGVTIANFSDGNTTGTYILSVAPGSSSARANIRFGDRIVSINGKGLAGTDVSEVRDLLRGEAGTTLKLTIESASTGKTEIVQLQRNVISQPSIPDAYILQPGIGYIDLTEGFNFTTADEFDRALRDLKRQGMRSLVLDLRGNGGGILQQAVKIAEKFLPAGTQILSQRGRYPDDNRRYISANSTPETMPLVVLINGRTASASEILAGAFQDDDRALIVGEKSYGKGLVQTVIDLPNGSGLTLTTGRYLTPSGRSIQRDYSSIDLYAYYNHTSPSSGTDKAFFEARTVTNRSVYGGDGIQPDEEINSMKPSLRQADLLDPIFFFARQMQDVTDREDKGRGSGSNRDGIIVSDKMLGFFSDFMVSRFQNRISRGTLIAEKAFIRTQLHHYLSMASIGPLAANRVLIVADPQVERGVKALPRAGVLASLAAKTRQIPN
jgi:carboxyl-terminal processing protease